MERTEMMMMAMMQGGGGSSSSSSSSSNHNNSSNSIINANNLGPSSPSPPPSSPSPSPSLARSVPSSSASASSALPFLQVADDQIFSRLSQDLTFTFDRKSETEQALMEELIASLRKEEKLLDADAWKYAAPRSQLHLASMTGVKLANANANTISNSSLLSTETKSRTSNRRPPIH